MLVQFNPWTEDKSLGPLPQVPFAETAKSRLVNNATKVITTPTNPTNAEPTAWSQLAVMALLMMESNATTDQPTTPLAHATGNANTSSHAHPPALDPTAHLVEAFPSLPLMTNHKDNAVSPPAPLTLEPSSMLPSLKSWLALDAPVPTVSQANKTSNLFV
jgi:hypothetical protein